MSGRSGFRAVVILCIVAVTWVNFNQERWRLKDVIAQDITNYYAYLPALFYKHDLSLSFLSDTSDTATERRYYAPNRTPDGKPVIKMSMGMAVSYLPFFAAAHIYASIFKYPVDGFSEPYHFAVLFSSLFYYIAGLFFLWKVLRLYFSHTVTTLTLFCLTFSTNVFLYLTMGGGLSHTVSFAFVALLLFYIIRWHQRPSIVFSIIIGVVIGYLTIVRPINFLLVIFFLLYPVSQKFSLREKASFLSRHSLHLLVIAISGFIIVLPQLIYWKFVSGHFFFNSYIDEKFYSGKAGSSIRLSCSLQWQGCSFSKKKQSSSWYLLPRCCSCIFT